MVMEKALPQLPEELVKNIEELAGIYRQPGYKELSESLKFLSSSSRFDCRLLSLNLNYKYSKKKR